MRDARGDVRLHARRSRLLDVWHVLEVVIAPLRSRGATEVVERDRREPSFREAQGELLVEAMEPADVWEDHDADARSPRGRNEGREAVPVGRIEDEIVV